MKIITDKQAELLAELFSRKYHTDDMTFTLSDLMQFGFRDKRPFFALVRSGLIVPAYQYPDDIAAFEAHYRLNNKQATAAAAYHRWYENRGWKQGIASALLD